MFPLVCKWPWSQDSGGSLSNSTLQDSLELELGASATGVHKIPAPSGAPAAASSSSSNILDPQAHARRLKHKSSSGSKDASGMSFPGFLIVGFVGFMQGDWWFHTTVDFVDFNLGAPPLCPLAMPSLPTFYLPKQNPADRGTPNKSQQI